MQEETRKGNLQRAAELQYGEIPKLEAELRELTAEQDAAVREDAAEAATGVAKKPSRMLKEEVDEEDIAAIVSKWTGIPVCEDARRRDAEAGADGGSSARARGWAG